MSYLMSTYVTVALEKSRLCTAFIHENACATSWLLRQSLIIDVMFRKTFLSDADLAYVVKYKEDTLVRPELSCVTYLSK